jgi:hypothetical protein
MSRQLSKILGHVGICDLKSSFYFLRPIILRRLRNKLTRSRYSVKAPIIEADPPPFSYVVFRQTIFMIKFTKTRIIKKRQSRTPCYSILPSDYGRPVYRNVEMYHTLSQCFSTKYETISSHRDLRMIFAFHSILSFSPLPLYI